MKTYELTYIIASNTSLDEADAKTKEIESFIQSKEGVILKLEKTGIKSLSYPIKKQSSGYFITLEFQIAENNIKELKERLEKDQKILRHFILVKQPTKVLKERRRRPSPEIKPVRNDYPQDVAGEEKKKTEKVEMEEIEKKLDEILSE